MSSHVVYNLSFRDITSIALWKLEQIRVIQVLVNDFKEQSVRKCQMY